jgi:transposase InsO family protein
LSLRTSAGIAQVRHLSSAFDLSPAALYKAAHATNETPAVRSAKINPAFVPDDVLFGAIDELTAKHPGLGYRKIWALLRRAGTRVGRRRVWAMMHAAGLTFQPNARRSEPRRGTVVAEFPNRRWSSDMTTTWTRNDGWIAITPVIDNGCRTLLAIGISKAQDATAILAPTRRALEEAFGSPLAVPDGLEYRTDHGSVFTGSDCGSLCQTWRLDHTFSPVGRPTGNAVAERIIQTMKIELLWTRDWENLEELRVALEQWRLFYNTERPHEALNWETPAERRAESIAGQRALPVAA